MFKSIEELKNAVRDAELENAVIFDGDTSYYSAAVGYDITGNDEHVIYDYDKMISFLIDNCEMTEEDAVEWIDYNTIRALPYVRGNAPIIMKKFEG